MTEPNDRYSLLREFYDHFAEVEEGALRVGHRSTDAQLVRFEVLLAALDPAHHPASVLDVGCGVADLFGYLDETGRLGRYVGTDLLPAMIEEGRRRYPRAELLVGDILEGAADERFDLVVASGTLNIAVDDHEDWVRSMLAAMWARTERALAVNFTSTRAYQFDVQARFDTDVRYLDPIEVLSRCRTLTPWVTLREDYMARDATIYLYRSYHRAAATMRDRTWTTWSTTADRACTLASIFTERGLATDALAVLEAAPATAAVLLARGAAQHTLRDFGAARESYRAALELDPELSRAKKALAWLDATGL